jgi:hypothetical protein
LEDVISAVILLFSDNTLQVERDHTFWGDVESEQESLDHIDISAVEDSSWHGACLALAEVARQGALHESRLNEILPWLIKVLVYMSFKNCG